MSAVARASPELVVFVAPEVAYLGVAANCVTFRCRKAVGVHGDDPRSQPPDLPPGTRLERMALLVLRKNTPANLSLATQRRTASTSGFPRTFTLTM